MGAKSAEGMYSWTRQMLEDQITYPLCNMRPDATAEALASASRKG